MRAPDFFFIIAVGIAGAYIFGGGNVISSGKIDINVQGPRTIGGGELLELQVAVRNNNKARLELADLVIGYPPGTKMPTDLSTTMTNQRISLGVIEPGETRTGTVRAVLFGKRDEQQNITVALEYRLKDSSALFNAETTYSVMITSDALEVVIEAGEEVAAGQQTALTVTVTSHTRSIIKDLILRTTYPFGFTIEETEPEENDDGLWLLGDLEPGESRTIRILGRLDGQTGDERTFRFLAGTRGSPQRTTVDVILAEAERKVSIKRPFLGMSLTFNGRPAASYVARTGQAVPVELTWNNNVQAPLNDVVIAATLSGDGLDPFAISVNDGFYRSIDSVVLWDKTSTRGELGAVPAGADGDVSLRLTPKPADQMLGIVDPTIKFELHAAAQRLGAGSTPETIQAVAREEIKVATDVTFNGRALYFENPLGSVGPLPPKVEHETTYGILWSVTNTTSLVRDARVTATLPPYVRWLGVVSPSAERVTFNENDGTITWHIGKLLPDTGVGGKTPRRVVFSIGLVPSTSQVNSSPVLVGSQLFAGTDNFTSTFVEAQADDLTTQLDEQDFGEIYGRVVR
ncbi:MAG: hypothetical protein Q8P16_00570, partial [bacterium]|nr:hypothetical protein [bacterium]